MRRWLLHFLWLSAFGLLSASLAVLAARTGADRATEQWLRAICRSRTDLFDAEAARWLHAARDRADELSALLAQLPEGPPGAAARVTILRFLERRLADQPEMDRVIVLDRSGHALLQAQRPSAPPLQEDLEVAQAAARPALMIVRAPSSAGTLLAAAPVLAQGKLRGVLAGRIAAGAVERLLETYPSGLALTLVDAAGVELGRPLPPALRELGSQGSAGSGRQGERLFVHSPIQSARAMLVVSAPRPPWLPGWRTGYWLALVLILLAAGGAAWLLARRLRTER